MGGVDSGSGVAPEGGNGASSYQLFTGGKKRRKAHPLYDLRKFKTGLKEFGNGPGRYEETSKRGKRLTQAEFKVDLSSGSLGE